ncbi:MAG: SDR family oxidoreductase [Rhizobiaceae bacterium]
MQNTHTGPDLNTQRPLENQTAIITGAARNLGAHFALGLAAAGANTLIHYNADGSGAEAESVAEAAQKFGTKSVAIQTDLTSKDGAKLLFEKAEGVFDKIDILINNAGAMHKAPIADTSEEDFDRVFALNSKAAFFIMKEAGNKLQDNGRIINIGTSLLGAFTGYYAAYAGSKAPLEDFSRALAKEVGNRGITVNTVCPGPLETSFLTDAEPQEALDWLASASVAGRLGQVEDITPWIVFLASPGARWATGQTIFVNGGFATR